ncbi:MFS transporter [Streptomyces sp. NPDC086766]|uniref:MFS transporter n=1 Tax=Streptomyces sp. NPDC086766 TaxID=3365754 RepID=UPI003816FE5C
MPRARSETRGSNLPIVLGLSLAFTVTVLDPLLLSLNLAEVSRALHVPQDLVGLLGGAATLVVASAVLAAGGVGDAFGLKRLLMVGLVIVTIANLLSTLSSGYRFLLAMRFLDGVGLTALLGVSMALLKASVPSEKRPAALGVFMAIEMFVVGLTPAIAGWLVEGVGWRSLFLISPLLCLCSFWLTARRVPEPPAHERRPLDVIAVLLVGVALLSLVVGMSSAQNGFARPETWVPLLVTVLAAVLFVLHERRAPEPAVDLALFRVPAFNLALAAALTLNFLGAGFSFSLGQFGGVVLALPPETIGLLFLPGTGLIAGTAVLAGRLMGKHTPRPVMVTGLLTLLASGLVMAGSAGPQMALWLLLLATWLCNLGVTITSTSASETVLSHAPSGHTGTVSSVQSAASMTGNAFGPTVYLLLLNFFFQREWLADARTRGLSESQAEQAVNAVRSQLAVSPPGTAVYDPNLLRQSAGLNLGLDFSYGLRLTMLTVSFLPFGLALVAHYVMPGGWRLRRRRRETAPESGG